MQKNHIFGLVLTALMTAVICVLAPLSLPIEPVPVSLATFAVMLAAYLLGWKCGVVSVLIYILLGTIGLPVFSGYTAGVGITVGPTGGYILGYLPLAWITGWSSDRYSDKLRPVLGMILGTLVLYLLGTVWLAKQLQLTFTGALSAGVIPFIPGDTIKIIITAVLGPILKTALKKSGLIRN